MHQGRVGDRFSGRLWPAVKCERLNDAQGERTKLASRRRMNPEKIGKYKVIELLGRGGMGEVYLGEDPYIGRRVAIKVIKGADPAARDRFLHEARVIGGLAHPAIVSLLDFDFSGDEPFLVMELLKGQGLDVWLRSPHALSEQLVVLDDLCGALAYAHENGVLHRDVKPSNVQVLPNGHAKLMDFGIARGNAGKLTATGAIVGTPQYMAPEILKDSEYSTRSDLYACAVLLYEMFAGANPFAANTIVASLTNVLHLTPPDLRGAHPDFPPRLAETLQACLRKEPELRPDGFGALLAASREAAGGQAMAAVEETRAIPRDLAPAPPPTTGDATVSKTRTVWALAGSAGVAGAIGIIWLLSRGPAPGSAVSPTPTPAAAPMIERSPPPAPVSSPSEAPPPVETRAKPTPSPHRAADRSTLRTAAVESIPTPVVLPSETPPPEAVRQVSTPSPQTPQPIPTPVVTPTPAPVVPSVPLISLSGVTPRSLRRGSAVDLEVHGEGLRRDLKVVVMQGRHPAEGIRVLRVEFVSSRIMRIRMLVEPETPLLTYSLVFKDATGVVAQGLQIEVVL